MNEMSEEVNAHDEYIVLRADGPSVLDGDSHFVLDCAGPHAKAAKDAMLFYAERIKNKELANAIKAKLARDNKEREWYISTDPEEWTERTRSGPYASIEDAVENAAEVFDLAPGENFWVGQRRPWRYKMVPATLIRDIKKGLGAHELKLDFGEIGKSYAYEWLNELVSAVFSEWLRRVGCDTGLWAITEIVECTVGE